MLFLHNNLRALKDDFAFTVEHQLLKHYGDKLDGESVGWVNNVIESMWTQINPVKIIVINFSLLGLSLLLRPWMDYRIYLFQLSICSLSLISHL